MFLRIWIWVFVYPGEKVAQLVASGPSIQLAILFPDQSNTSVRKTSINCWSTIQLQYPTCSLSPMEWLQTYLAVEYMGAWKGMANMNIKNPKRNLSLNVKIYLKTD